MQRHLRYLTIVVLFLAPGAFAQAGGDARPSANGPIRLADGGVNANDAAAADVSNADDTIQESQLTNAASTAGDKPRTADRPESTDDTAVASGDDDSAASKTSDALPLGMPNGIFSARPADSVETETPTETGWMGSLDPRRNDFVRVLGALAVVIGLLLFARAVLRKAPGLTGGFRPSGVVEVLARYPVGRGQQLIILKLARRVVLLHHAGNTMRTLTEIEDPNEVASLLARMEAGATGRGKSVFKSVLGKYQDEHKRAMAPRNGKRQYWANDLDTGEVVDLTQRSNGKTRAAPGSGSPLPEIVTQPRAARRGLVRR